MSFFKDSSQAVICVTGCQINDIAGNQTIFNVYHHHEIRPDETLDAPDTHSDHSTSLRPVSLDYTVRDDDFTFENGSLDLELTLPQAIIHDTSTIAYGQGLISCIQVSEQHTQTRSSNYPGSDNETHQKLRGHVALDVQPSTTAEHCAEVCSTLEVDLPRIFIERWKDLKAILNSGFSRFSTVKVPTTRNTTSIIIRTLLQVYLCLLWRLPRHYSSKARAVLETANANAQGNGPHIHIDMPPSEISFPLHNPMQTWEDFLDSLLIEWKCIRFISAILIPLTLGAAQISGAGDDPTACTVLVVSLVCAFVGVLSVSMLLAHFSAPDLRKESQASYWAGEARMSKPLALWNTWVCLAMPAVWMVWGTLLFGALVIHYAWTSQTTLSSTSPKDQNPRPSSLAHGLRIIIIVFVGIGIVDLVMIRKTLNKSSQGPAAEHDVEQSTQEEEW